VATTSSTVTSNNGGGCTAGATYAPSGGTVAESTAQMVINPSNFNKVSGSNPGPNNQENQSSIGSTDATQQGWGTASYFGYTFPGVACISNCPTGNLSSIVWSGTGATVNWTGAGSISNLVSGGAIRIWNATNTNLNGVYMVGTVSTNSFTITSTCGASFSQQACPTSQTYNSGTDSGLIITIDPYTPSGGWHANPLQSFYNLLSGITHYVPNRQSILGSLFSTTYTLYSYEGNPANVAATHIFTSSPNVGFTFAAYGEGVWNEMNMQTGASSINIAGLGTRPWQTKPRTALWYMGMVGGGQSVTLCGTGWIFVPYCDRPSDILFRGEEVIAQRMGFFNANVIGDYLYNILGNAGNIAGLTGRRGWNAGGGAGASNQANNPIGWHAAALFNAFETLTADTHLQPESNTPYFGPYFSASAHTSSTYGNSILVTCGSEDLYGAFPIPLAQISGGTTIKYYLNARTLTPGQVVAGNPMSETIDPCQDPITGDVAAGQSVYYVSQPPGYTALDQITFAPPMLNGVVRLPFGASKFLVQVGYYPQAMQDDPVTDCTLGCIVGVDHHSNNAWYRIMYTDSNNLPRSIGDPVQMRSQGMP